jgi:hypothetical protein
MSIFRSFLPTLLFVFLFVGSGLYFSVVGTDNAFYQLSPVMAIIPAIALAWILNKGLTEEKMNAFLDAVYDIVRLSLCVSFFYSLEHLVKLHVQ